MIIIDALAIDPSNNFDYDSGYEDNTQYIDVTRCGYQKFITRNHTTYRENGTADYQIIYIAKGKGYFIFDNTKHDIPEGNIIIFRPHEKHYYTYKCEDSTLTYWVHFSGYGVEDILTQAELFKKRYFYIGYMKNIVDMYENILVELQQKKPLFGFLTSSILGELISQMSRRITELESGSKSIKNNQIFKTVEVMHQKYNENLPLEYYANLSNFSVYWFVRSFKNIIGVPPQKFILKIRIDKARELLSSSDLNIKEVSNIIGYDNPFYFSRIFKKVTGLSPSDFKNSIRLHKEV